MPPEEFWRGTRPRKAANSRPERNRPGSVIEAASAVAVITPTPRDRRQPLAVLVLSMPDQKATLQSVDLEIQSAKLIGQHQQSCARDLG